jgi:hypothetical protein
MIRLKRKEARKRNVLAKNEVKWLRKKWDGKKSSKRLRRDWIAKNR